MLVKSSIPHPVPTISARFVLAQPATTSARPVGDEEASAIPIAVVLSSSLVERAREMRENVETRAIDILSLKGEVEQAWAKALIYQKRVAELKEEEEEEKEKVEAEKVLSDLAKDNFKKKVAELKREGEGNNQGNGVCQNVDN
ncbi:hypothetical protein Acr_00g0031340 [Actinidia rufa]|uniref:Uncharacterized protein n=1 Tax=Actinidia rufa TaxID=165716 RepID=A0A7J0DF40_9ERIC|nr:hypothetical protein Acr_00g0031340 [Actinidia rufa]